MTTEPKTYSEIYMTVSRKGTHYSHLNYDAGRLVRISDESAEASIATGATVYRKAVGQHWLNAEAVTL